MKLYTEEEIRKFFTEKYDEGLSIDELIEILTPIELPSDEEIREVINPFQNEMDDFDLGFRNGVQWLRDKIKEVSNDKQ